MIDTTRRNAEPWPATRGEQAAPTVSVVIPTFNRAHLLPDAVNSVLDQTVPVLEILIADDGSTDDTVAWVRRRAATEPRIKLIPCVHGGVSRARNAAIAEAQGEWIAFIDSDDQWEPAKLDRQFRLLARDRDLVALFSGLSFHDGARPLLPRQDPSLFALRCTAVVPQPSVAVVRTDALRAVGGFDPDLPTCEDWDLWFRLRKLGRFGVVREPLVRMGCSSNLRLSADLDKMIAGYRIVFERLREGVASPWERWSIAAAHRLVFADLMHHHGRSAEALRLAAVAFVQRPRAWAARVVAEAMIRVLRQGLDKLGRSRLEPVRQ